MTPASAVQTGQEGAFVYVIDGDQAAALRSVTPGPTIEGRTAITTGLNGGERVVTDGQLRLSPGTKVEVLDTPTPEKKVALDAEAPRP